MIRKTTQPQATRALVMALAFRQLLEREKLENSAQRRSGQPHR